MKRRCTFPASTVGERRARKQLGKAILEARQLEGLTARELAKRAGLPRDVLKALERGYVKIEKHVQQSIFSALRTTDPGLVKRAIGSTHCRGLARRHAALEIQVAVGVRDARSLVVFSSDFAARAYISFPKDAFGEAAPW